MTNDNDGYNDTFSRDEIIAEVLLRITALENLLIAKGIITNAEIQEQLVSLSKKINQILNTNNIAMLPQDTNKDILDTEYQNLIKDFSLTTKKISKGN